MENLECEDEVGGTEFVLGDLYTVLAFHDSEVFHNVDEAFKRAFDIEGSLEYGCEYGVCFRDQSSVYFPSISYEEADLLFREWWENLADCEFYDDEREFNENEEIN